MQIQCQFCGAIQKKDGQYDGIKRHPLYYPSDGWSHGTCPECYEEKIAEWGLKKISGDNE